MRSRATLILLAQGAVWGASFLFIKVIVEEIAPIELVLARVTLGAIAVLAVLMFRGGSILRSPAMTAKVAVLALFGTVLPFTLIAWAEVHIDSGVASVLNSSMPLFTALFAAAVLAEEEFTPWRLAGLFVGFAGVIVLTGGDIWDVRENSVLGQLAVVGAAACYATSAVYARTLLRSEDPLSLSALQLTLAALLALPIAVGLEGVPEYSLSLKAGLALIALGLLSTGLAYATYLWLVDNIGSVRASLVTYVVPAIALLLGWAVLDERLAASTLAGAGLIAVGIAAVLRGDAPATQRAVMPSAEATGGKEL